MYINQNHSVLLIIITIGLFVLPLLWSSIKRKLFAELNLKSLTRVFNRALIAQIVVGILLLIITFSIDKLVYSNGDGNLFTELFIESTYYYVVIGVFIYLPCVGILNLINWTQQKFGT